MSNIEERLEDLIAKVRTLPKDRQELAVSALSEIAEDVYALSDEELSVVLPALQDAQHGRDLEDLDAVDVLNKPWT